YPVGRIRRSGGIRQIVPDSRCPFPTWFLGSNSRSNKRRPLLLLLPFSPSGIYPCTPSCGVLRSPCRRFPSGCRSVIVPLFGSLGEALAEGFGINLHDGEGGGGDLVTENLHACALVGDERAARYDMDAECF